jgi:hypothetical protein
VPQSLAQFMGMFVTAMVVLGSDLDVLYAVPLGIFAGALTTFFASVAAPTNAKATRREWRWPWR